MIKRTEGVVRTLLGWMPPMTMHEPLRKMVQTG